MRALAEPERDAIRARAMESTQVLAAWEDARWRLVDVLQDPSLAPWDKSAVERRLKRCTRQLAAAQAHQERAVAAWDLVRGNRDTLGVRNG